MYCKSRIPGYYIMSDLNEDTGSSWPLYFDNKKPNGHLYSGCMLNYLSGYSEYDKEMLKRTMLEHEAIFKRQVYELHRLYRIQKNLMEDFQKNDLYRFSTWPIKSKSTFSSSGVQSQDTRKMWQVSHQTVMSSSMSRETAAETDMNISPICFCESNLQSSIGQLENGATERDGESNPRFRVHMKRMFDLRLPADGYIDCEGTEKSEKEDVAGSSSVTRVLYSKNCNADPENEVKLTLANVGSPNGREGVQKSNSLRKGILFHGLADLNEPIKETSSEGTPYSVPARLLFEGTQPDDYQKHNGSCTSNNLWLQSSFSRDRDCDERGSSNTLPVKEEINQVWSQFHCEAGQHSSNRSPDYGKENCPVSFETVQVKVNKADAKFVQKQSTSWKILGNSSHRTVSDNPENLASVLPNSLVAPQMDMNATTSPPLPTWMKPLGGENHSSVPLETTSSFDRSTAMNKFRRLDTTTGDSSTLYDTLHFSGNSRSHRCLETGPFCHQSGFNHVFHLDSQSTSQAKPSYTNSNLNLIEYSFGIQDHTTAQENKVSGMDGDCKGYSSGLSWLKNQPSCSEFLDLKRFPSKMDLCFSTSGLVSETEIEIRTTIPSCNLESFPSSLHAIDDKAKRNEIPDSSSDKYIFGYPIFDEIHPNPGSKNQRQLQVTSSQQDCLFCDLKPFNTERESSVEKSRSFKNNIDLNCEVPILDESVFSKIYAKIQDAVPLQILDSSISTVLPFIDLEAPVLSPEEDNITQIESSPSKREGVQQDGCSRDMFFKEAAKNLIELSLDKFNQSNDKQSCLTTTLPCSTLHWFADVVLSNTDAKIPAQDGGVDLFELMTLQLEEMKPEELWCNPQEVETASDDTKSRAFLLPKKPRKGQARKRRQRRDFQKDTLPGLATLSRQEVNEDLQTIGGMMKASGCPWELGMGSRNAGRNGSKVHARGRRQPRNTAVIVTDVQLSPPQTLFLGNKNTNNPEFEVDKPGMVGWGRTTRRCRRQRCPPPSITTALT